MARLARSAAVPPPVALPGDVRLMNLVAGSIFVLAVLAMLGAGVMWLSRSPAFSIRSIQLEGEIVRNNVNTIRANTTSRLAGNFFSVDLAKARAAFESVPWVRRAVVRRIWPDRLVVQLEEHHAAALWQDDDRGDRLVNSHGEVFVANVGDVEDEALPTFGGPEGSSAPMLAMYERLQPVLRKLGIEIEVLSLSTRGSWRVLLDNGAAVELGRGSEKEVAERTERFVRTLPEITKRYRQPLEYADLRHTDGYAVRLRGVTTAVPSAGKP